MIDTILLQLNNKHFDIDKMHQTFTDKLAIQHLTNYKQGYQGTSLTATHKNFKFFLNNTSLKAAGSITKLGNGNNPINASHEAIRSALDHLQDILDIPLREANIKRLDVGYNIALDNPVRDYLRLLIPPSSLTVFTVGDQTKEFRNRLNNLTICFYNKIAEAFKQGKVPAVYQKQNILRYEVRLKTPTLNKLGFIDLRYVDLYDENIYKQLVKVWYDQYLSVPKIVDPQPKKIAVSSVTAFRDSLDQFGYSFDVGIMII